MVWVQWKKFEVLEFALNNGTYGRNNPAMWVAGKIDNATLARRSSVD